MSSASSEKEQVLVHAVFEGSDKVVDTIRRRMDRAEQVIDAMTGTPSPQSSRSMIDSPSSISHARFAALSSRLAQVAAKASADAMAVPASAHTPMPADAVLRFLSDLRRMADAIAAISTGDVHQPGGSGHE